MKRNVFIICALFNVLGFFIQPCEAQLSSSQLSRFLSYNDNEGYRVIQLAAHPTNRFKYGTVLSVSGNEAYVEIHMRGWITDDICTKVKLYYDSSFNMFSNVDDYADTDVVSAFTALEAVKNYAVEKIQNTDSMNKISRYFGGTLQHLGVRKICAAYLSYLWMRFPKSYDSSPSTTYNRSSISGRWSFVGTLLNEKNKYDQIAFELDATSSGSCTGRFLNYTYGWYPNVTGYLSSDSFTVKGGNWTFNLRRRSGNNYVGTATSGNYTYQLELSLVR